MRWKAVLIFTWLLLIAPVGAAPQLAKVEPSPDGKILFTGSEPLTYEVKPSAKGSFVFLLKGATLTSGLSTLIPANFGSLALTASDQGVTVRVVFKDPTTTAQFTDSPLGLLLQVKAPTISQVVTPVPPPRSRQDRVTLKAKNQEVRETLTLLSRVSRTSIAIDPKVDARVTVSLENVPFEDALKSITTLGNLEVRKEGEIFVVAPRPAPPQPGQPGADDGGLKDVGDPRPRSNEDNPGERLVSVIANDTELGRILKEMANQANVELIINGQLNEPASVRLINRTFDDSLGQLLAGTSFGFSRTGNVYRVGDATPGTTTSKSFAEVKVIRLANSNAKTLFDLLPPAFAALSQGIRVDEPRNALVISGPPSFQTQIANLVKTLDTPIPEVSFGVKIIELDESGSQAFNAVNVFRTGTGSTSGTSPLSLASSLNKNDPVTVLAFDNFARILDVVDGLVNKGKGKTLTDTKVTTISGQTAAINVSQDINITTTTPTTSNGITSNSTQIQTIQAGTVVQITPTVQADGNVFTDIKIESSVPGKQASASVAPNVSRRQVTNKLILRDGETVEIGGLIQHNVQDNQVRIPILGYLPIIGDLLSTTSRSDETSELLVFVTAYVNRRSPKPEVIQTDPNPIRIDVPDVLKVFPDLKP